MEMKIINMNAVQDFDFEIGYWGDCTNTFDEEQKHYVYADCMNLNVQHYRIIMESPLKILDVGGGPVSMLLKTSQLSSGVVFDPIDWPDWVKIRYACKNIEHVCDYAENLNLTGFDEVWMYNCLQHTHDPEKIIKNCIRAGKVFRIFEWIDIPPHDGHPQMLTKELLDKWTGSSGKINTYNDFHGCTGKAYSNVIC